MKDIFYLPHNGGYIGGVIIVVADNLDEAKQLIQNHFDDNFIKSEDYDLSKIVPLQNNTSRVEFFQNGDY